GRGGALSAAQNDRCPAARDRPETADHREQQGRTEALKEVAVDLARKPAAAVKSGRRRGQRNRDAVGPDGARPDHVGALLPGLQRRLVLTDETRAARDEDAAAVVTADVLADDRAGVAGYVGVDRGFEDRGDHRALRDRGSR